MINESGVYNDSVVTEVEPFTAFYPAEDYHQDYITHNPNNPYVRGVSKPRFEKFKKKYEGKLKE
jgi:peptide-methionine (S)-S-oxide reductase